MRLNKNLEIAGSIILNQYQIYAVSCLRLGSHIVTIPKTIIAAGGRAGTGQEYQGPGRVFFSIMNDEPGAGQDFVMTSKINRFKQFFN